MAEFNTAHDRFFKRFFGELAVAADFLRNYLPAVLLARLRLETLELEKESFVDPGLRQHFSDLLFKARLTTGEAVYVFLLLEHKSAPDGWVAFQLLRYLVQFWERQRQQGCARLPLILPIVFYHGQERWNVPRRLSALFEPAGLAEWLKHLPDFEYELRDVSLSGGGGELKGTPKLRAGLGLLRYIFSDELARRLPEIFRNLRELSRAEALEFARTLVAYLSSAGRKVKKEVVEEAMEEVFAQDEFDKSALFIQEWMEEGRQEGLSTLTLRQLGELLGAPDEMSVLQIQALPNAQLEELGVALLKFKTFDDLHAWLRAHTAEN